MRSFRHEKKKEFLCDLSRIIMRTLLSFGVDMMIFWVYENEGRKEKESVEHDKQVKALASSHGVENISISDQQERFFIPITRTLSPRNATKCKISPLSYPYSLHGHESIINVEKVTRTLKKAHL
jgi:hypothetical protein